MSSCAIIWPAAALVVLAVAGHFALAQGDGKTPGVAENAPELIRSFQHGDGEKSDRARGLEFSPDGKHLVTCGGKFICLWDFQKGIQKLKIKRSKYSFTDLRFRADGRQFATATREGNIFLWDLAGRLEGSYDLAAKKKRNIVYRLAYSPDGGRLAAACENKIAYIWTPKTGRLLQKLVGHTGEVRDVAFHPSEGHIVGTTGYDHTARLWDLNKRKSLLTYKHDPIVVYALDFRPDGKYAASAAGSGETVHIWRVADGAAAGTFATGHPGAAFQRLRWSPDGKQLAVAGGVFSKGFFSLWSIDIKVGKLDARRLAILQTDGRGTGIRALDFSPDGRIVATGDASGKIRLWNPKVKR